MIYEIFNIRILSAFISINKVRQYFEARGSELLPAGIPAGRISVKPVTAVQKAETANKVPRHSEMRMEMYGTSGHNNIRPLCGNDPVSGGGPQPLSEGNAKTMCPALQ
ncbi:MAG: hypothetical protein IKG46_09905 [Solobacterium sp.]|nr:hypothetical protein [Solobacterium sp.]